MSIWIGIRGILWPSQHLKGVDVLIIPSLQEEDIISRMQMLCSIFYGNILVDGRNHGFSAQIIV